MLIDENFKIKISKKNIEWYKSIGVPCSLREIIYVNSSSLTKGSNLIVKVKCDNCDKVLNRMFADYIIQHHNTLPHDLCKDCKGISISKSSRFEFEFVNNYFSSQNCTLLSKDYINAHQKLEYICNCGNTSTINFSDFKKGNRCKKCSIIRNADNRRTPLIQVENYFLENGCLLLSDTYKNTEELLDFICVCGNQVKMTFGNFKAGKRCKHCRSIKIGDASRLSFDFIKSEFEKNGCILLSKSYKNYTQKLDFICSCGTIGKIQYATFREGHRCNNCWTDRIAEKLRHPYDFVKEIFALEGCILITEEYINSTQKLRYVCVCGNEAEISFSNFKKGQKCYKCGKEKMAGENNHFWRGGITELSVHIRGKLNDWKTNTLKKDNYLCYITKEKGNLEIHHLYPFHKILRETLKELKLPLLINISEYSKKDLKNVEKEVCKKHSELLGVSLKKEIHNLYHRLYGYDNTPEQFEEFKMRYKFGEFKDVV